MSSENSFYLEVGEILLRSSDPKMTIGRIINSLPKCKKVAIGNIKIRLEKTQAGLKVLCASPYAETELRRYLTEALIHGRTKAFAGIMLERGGSEKTRRRRDSIRLAHTG